MNIILTGFMGTGKSTVGRLLADQLGYTFVDTDTLIEERSGMTVAAIFAELGEEAFREMERDAARLLADESGLVIATGGRMMLDSVCRKSLERSGRVFCLTASADEILARISLDATERPLLNAPDPAQRIRTLLAERAEGYARFPQVETGGHSPAEIAAEIVGAFALEEAGLETKKLTEMVSSNSFSGECRRYWFATPASTATLDALCNSPFTHTSSVYSPAANPSSGAK